MTKPAIIAVAITGSVPRQSDHPAVPVPPANKSSRHTRPLRRGPPWSKGTFAMIRVPGIPQN